MLLMLIEYISAYIIYYVKKWKMNYDKTMFYIHNKMGTVGYVPLYLSSSFIFFLPSSGSSVYILFLAVADPGGGGLRGLQPPP